MKIHFYNRDDYNSLTGKLFITYNKGNYKIGLPHFTEHLLFKKLMRDNYNIENKGINIYANTTSDFIWFELNARSEHATLAVKALMDMIIYYEIQDRDLEAERKVIYEELAYLESDPEYMVKNSVIKKLWEDNFNSKSVIGNYEDILNINKKDINEFLNDNSSNLFLSLYGKANLSEIVFLLENYNKENHTNNIKDIPKINEEKLNINIQSVLSSDTSEVVHTCIGYKIYNWKKYDRWVFDLINTYLGDGLGSKLNTTIRDDKSLVYEVWSDCNYFEEDMQFLIGFTSTKRNVERVIALIKKLVTTLILQEDELYIAKQKLISELTYAYDDAELYTYSVARYYLQMNQILSLDSIKDRINSIELHELNQVIRVIFNKDMVISQV
ncbi:M16 family metallopeptidase [Virgibacillus pantothenticus]|uniref:M16 family metallopeptidase n=1 Tax=Virgibacillus pantothenticus TaxID=1473 RepID=UPI0009851895|nr:pitrilysin family protein [Virgibacillus pantothenticus]